MPPKKKATTFTTDWQSRKATASALSTFMEAFTNEVGEGGLVTIGKNHKPLDVIPTGSMNLDLALGTGGWPLGRVVELWGPEHSGKTSLAMLAVASAQRAYPDKACAWVDMEQTFDETWAETLGVDLDRLVIVKNPHSAEDVADSYKRMVMSGLFSLAVLDSVGGMISRVEFEKESDEATVAKVAQIVTRMVKQVAPMARSNDTCSMVINQVRSNIGGYGASDTTGGGWALKHITSIKCAVRRGESKSIRIDGKDTPVGHEVNVRIQKNKLAPHGRVGAFWLYNTRTADNLPGVDPIPEIVEVGKKVGVIEGSTYLTLPSGARLNGKAKTVEHLRDHPDEVEDISQRIKASLATVEADGPVEEDVDEETEAMIKFVSTPPFGEEEGS